MRVAAHLGEYLKICTGVYMNITQVYSGLLCRLYGVRFEGVEPCKKSLGRGGNLWKNNFKNTARCKGNAEAMRERCDRIKKRCIKGKEIKRNKSKVPVDVGTSTGMACSASGNVWSSSTALFFLIVIFHQVLQISKQVFIFDLSKTD